MIDTKKGFGKSVGRSIAFRRIGAEAGIVAPILFALLVAVESLLRPGYSQAYNNISDLGVGPNAIIQNANFIIFGLLVIVFASSVRRTLTAKSGKNGARVAGILVASGLGTIVAGASLVFGAYFAHIVATFTTFIALVAAEFLTWTSLRNSTAVNWERYRTYSLISGLVSLVLLFVFSYTLSIAYPAGYTSAAVYPVGLTERLFVAVPLIWIAVTGAKIQSDSQITERGE